VSDDDLFHLDPLTFRRWAAGVLFAGAAVFIGYTLPHAVDSPSAEVTPRGAAPATASAKAPPAATAAPVPAKPSPAVDRLSVEPPPGPFGDDVRLGEAIFKDTKAHAGAFVGNDLSCSNCHLDRGRLAGSAPAWGAYVMFPIYRAKNGHVNTFAERLQGCFRYSMNGVAPPLGDKVLVALESYAAFLAKGLPTGVEPAGRGYPKLPKPAALDRVHGSEVYATKCALCHGADGAGQRAADGAVAFPALWGPRSYNWGAGMSSIGNAAGFIKANMPFSEGNSLSDRDAWDVAAYVDGQERPQDPRFKGSVAATRAADHDDPLDLYGTTVDGAVLGEHAPPSGTVAP
jgi:thiosulfate dehydrogenase